jgi:hypothetical protein
LNCAWHEQRQPRHILDAVQFLIQTWYLRSDALLGQQLLDVEVQEFEGKLREIVAHETVGEAN